jgi:ascorbate-specific PTS system EIIC-type component UlaA
METLFANAFNAAVLVPLGAFSVAIIAIISGAVSQAHARRIKAEQRIAMVQRGMTAEQIATALGPTGEEEEGEVVKTKDPLRSLAKTRRAATVLVSVGVGVVLFGLLLTVIERDRDVLTVAASGLIPLAIGIGFFVDYRLQQRELARFGLEVGAELPHDSSR